MLVGDLADDLLENVLERDQALDLAVLVDDQRELDLAALEGVELVVDRGGVRHEPRLARQRAHVEPIDGPAGPPERRQQILGMQHANDVVGFVLPDRHARELALDNVVDNLVRVVGNVDGLHLGAVDHDVVELQFLEIKHAAEALRLALVDGAFLGRQLDGTAQFVGGENIGVVVGAARRQPQDVAHDEVNGGGGRPEQRDKDVHDRCNHHREGGRVR